MPSFAGIVACGCFKIQPMNGESWNRNWSPSMPGHPAEIANLHDLERNEFQLEDAEKPLQGIEVTVHHALFERDNRVLCNRD